MSPTATRTRSPLWTSLLPPSAHGDDELCLESADGVRLRTTDGRDLLCATSGLWNVNLGYGNPAIADAVDRAMRRASYLGVFRYENAPAREAARALVDFAGADHYERVLFSTSGGAANDLVMKLVRQVHALRGEPQRRLVVGLRGGYHGLTFGSFALTSDDLGQQLYGVDRSQVRHVEINDASQLTRLLERSGSRVAAVVVEPLQGTGAVALSDEYAALLGRLCDEHGVLLVADEVATGFGRLGHPFASQTWDRAPDLLVTSKGLTNGTMAAAAVLLADHVADVLASADVVVGHAETQAGTAVTAAAILATIEQVSALDALASARRVGAGLADRLEALVAERDDVLATQGAGCFHAVRVAGPDGAELPGTAVGSLITEVRRAGAVVHPGPGGFQLVPPLIYTEGDLDELFACVRAGLDAFAVRGGGAR